MTIFQAAYRTTVYAPRSVDSTEATVLTANGIVHSDAFQITTLPSLTGWKPYMQMPTGRKGSIDFLSRQTDIGQVTVDIMDMRLTAGGSSSTRWVTGFLSGSGAIVGRMQLQGLKVLIEESLDGGVTWSAYFTGRLAKLELKGAAQYTMTVQGMSKDFALSNVFVGRPHSSVSYFSELGLLPLGPTSDFGAIKGVPELGATTDDGSQAKIFTDGGYPGSGMKVLQVDTVASEQNYNIITSALVGPGGATAIPGGNDWSPGSYFYNDSMRCHITVPGVGSGELKVQCFGIIPHVPGKWVLSELLLEELPVTDPNYIAFPATINTYVTLRILPPLATVSDSTPILLNDQHPVQILADILDGKFGYLTTGGVVSRSYLRNSASFTALLADPSFGTARFVITKQAKGLAWVEANLCQPFGLALYENAQGEIVVLDVRLPNSLAGLVTLTDTDLVADQALSWGCDAEQAITAFKVTTYVDTPVASENLWHDPAEFPTTPPARFTTQPADYMTLFFGGSDIVEKTQAIDAIGLRTMPTEQLNGQSRKGAVAAAAAQLTESYRRPFSAGPITLNISCRRTANVNSQVQGSWVLVSFSKLPDPQTNQRGGTRLMRVTQRNENKSFIQLSLLDAGPNVFAAAPTMGVLAAGNYPENEVLVPVTLNANGDPMVIQYAVTATGTGAAPSATSALWTFAQRVTASGTYTIRSLPGRRRIWFRGYSAPNPTTYDKALPSAYVTPAVGYIETSSIAAPTGLTISNITSKSAHLSWSVGSDKRHLVRVLLAQASSQAAADAATPTKLVDLMSGSTSYDLSGLDLSGYGPWYHPQVQFVDYIGGDSVVTDSSPNKSFQATGTPATAPEVTAVYVLPASNLLHALVPIDSNLGFPVHTGVALSIVPRMLGYDLVVQEAPDVAGAPGTWAVATRIPAASVQEAGTIAIIYHGLDNTTRWYRAYLTGASVSDGTPSSAVSAKPGLLSRDILQGKTIYPLMRTQAMDDGNFAVAAADNEGNQIVRTGKITGAGRTLAQLQTYLVPNAEFDIWESASQPHAWAVDTTAGAVAAQESSLVFSGDYALKYTNPDNATSSGWHGVTTNDLTKGAFCVPLRPRARYRVLVASRCDKVSTGASYRLTAVFNAAGTLTARQQFSYAAAGVYQLDEWFVDVPTNAEQNSKLVLEFNRNGDAATINFWVDSLRMDEETSNQGDNLVYAASQHGQLVPNGDFEQGNAFWTLYSGSVSATIESSAPISGSKSLRVYAPTGSPSAGTARVCVCDRAVDDSVYPSNAGNPVYFAVQPGDELSVRAKVKCVSGALASFVARVGLLGCTSRSGFGTEYTVLSQTAVDTATHTLLGTFVVPAGVNYVVPFVGIDWPGSLVGAPSWLFDDVAIFRVTHRAKCLAYRNAGYNLPNNVLTAIPLDGETYDSDAMHDTATNNTRITMPATAVGGVAMIVGQVEFTTSLNGTVREVLIRKNGATTLAFTRYMRETVAGMVAVSYQVMAFDPAWVPGDYYELLALQDSGAALALFAGSTNTWLSVTQLL